MAPRSIVRSLSRLSVAVAALMVSVSVIIGVGVMIGSFRDTVENWLDDVLQADIFITSPTLTSSQTTYGLDASLVDKIADLTTIEMVATSRQVDVAMFLESDPAAALPIRLAALSQDLAGPDRNYRDAIGDWQATWQAVEEGGIIVNEPMANRYDLAVGDMITLQTDVGRRSFPLVGIAVDYDVNLVAFLHDPVYREMWDDSGFSAIGAFVASGVDVDETVNELRREFANTEELLIRSNRSTRQNAMEVFDRTFAITVALRLLATLVAFIGILSTLMSLQLERSREIGILRSTGMTRRQLWQLSFLETGLIGSSAGLLAMPTGFVLAVILIYIINLRSFGWTLEMQLQPQEYLQAFLVALTAALLAGIYPAWKMGNAQPADALRSE
jgi:putative ABC transport system permease protein